MAKTRDGKAGAEMKKPHGNAFKWTPEIEEEIFKRIANGESLRKICEDDWLPGRETVRKRLMDDADFVGRYAQARVDQADKIVDEILEIADDATNDWMEANGEDAVGYKLNGEHVQRSKLRIDARKWLAGKLAPKVYGERQAVELTGKDGGPIQTVDPTKLSTEALREIMGAMNEVPDTDER